MPGREKSLQELLAPNNKCFGCGWANEKGLRLQSYAQGDLLIAEFSPEPHHQAFEGILNGGIIGTLLDCHCNWAAAYHLMKKLEQDSLPCTVTAEYKITMSHPTPGNGAVRIEARVTESTDRKVFVEGQLGSSDQWTATCNALFVAVKPGHPAYNRW